VVSWELGGGACMEGCHEFRHQMFGRDTEGLNVGRSHAKIQLQRRAWIGMPFRRRCGKLVLPHRLSARLALPHQRVRSSQHLHAPCGARQNALTAQRRSSQAKSPAGSKASLAAKP
jgi:hypothetical protein